MCFFREFQGWQRKAVIRKSANPRCLTGIANEADLPCRYFNQPKAWMKTDILEEIPGRLNGRLRRQNRKILFFIDNAPCHPEDLDGKFSQIEIIFLPKNTTSRLDGTVTGDILDKLPNFHIDTFSELEEHSGRFAEVSESDVEKFNKGEENANTKKKTFYDHKLAKKFQVEERHEIRETEKILPSELDSYLSQFVLAARTKTGKDYEPSSLRLSAEFLLVLNAI